MVHQIKDPLLLGELDLGLGGVDVHVDPGLGQLQIDHAGGEAPHQQGVFVGLLHGALQQLGADEAPVAVEELGGAVAAPGRGGGGKAVYLHVPVLAPDGQQILCHVAAQQRVDRGLRLSVAGGEELLLSVADEAHGNLGPAQGAAQRGLDTGGGLGPVGF